jgi:hypothetical protein
MFASTEALEFTRAFQISARPEKFRMLEFCMMGPHILGTNSMLMGLYVSTNRNHNPFNCKNFHNEKIDANANKDKHIKEPFFFFVITMMQLKRLSPEKNQFRKPFVASVATRSKPYCFKRSSHIEGYFGPVGIYHEIGHFSQLNEISPEFVVAQIHELKVLNFDRRQNLQKYFQPVGLLQVGSYKAFAISQAFGD